MPGSESVPAAIATEAAVSSIGSSYASSWAAVRRPPRRENLLADAQPAISEPSTPTPITASTKKMPASSDLADRALARADRDGEQHQEVRQQGDGRGELEDAAVGVGRDDVLLLRELHAVGDELGPAVEAAGVHRAERGPACGP